MKPLALFLGGTNGSGKSTLRGFSKEDGRLLSIDPDQLAKQQGGDNYKGWKEAVKLFSNCIKNKTLFSMETTLTGNTVLKRMQKTKESGFYVELSYVGLNSAQLNVQRVAKGGHDIPKDTIIKRYDESREKLIEAIKIADKVEIFDNTKSFKKDMIIENQKVIFQSEDCAKWIKDVITQINLSNIEDNIKETKKLKKEFDDIFKS